MYFYNLRIYFRILNKYFITSINSCTQLNLLFNLKTTNCLIFIEIKVHFYFVWSWKLYSFNDSTCIIIDINWLDVRIKIKNEAKIIDKTRNSSWQKKYFIFHCYIKVFIWLLTLKSEMGPKISCMFYFNCFIEFQF